MPESAEVIALDTVVGDDEIDTRLLREMAGAAERYLRSFNWCLRTKAGYLADGIGGVIAIFLFQVDIANIGDDKWIWIFIGDVPNAYLEMDHDYRSPYDALKRYIEGIEEWVTAARRGLSLDDLIPIDAPTDSDSLDELAGRADTLRQHILPHISGSKFQSGTQSAQ